MKPNSMLIGLALFIAIGILAAVYLQAKLHLHKPSNDVVPEVPEAPVSRSSCPPDC